MNIKQANKKFREHHKITRRSIEAKLGIEYPNNPLHAKVVSLNDKGVSISCSVFEISLLLGIEPNGNHYLVKFHDNGEYNSISRNQITMQATYGEFDFGDFEKRATTNILAKKLLKKILDNVGFIVSEYAELYDMDLDQGNHPKDKKSPS